MLAVGRGRAVVGRGCKTECMGLFRRRRTQTDFDPSMWSDAADRSPVVDDDAWFAGPDEDAPELRIATNSGARFDDADQAWLADDPGAAIRAKKHKP